MTLRWRRLGLDVVMFWARLLYRLVPRGEWAWAVGGWLLAGLLFAGFWVLVILALDLFATVVVGTYIWE